MKPAGGVNGRSKQAALGQDPGDCNIQGLSTGRSGRSLERSNPWGQRKQSSKISKKLAIVLEIQEGGLKSERSIILPQINNIVSQILCKFKWLTLIEKPDNFKEHGNEEFYKVKHIL